MQQPDACVGGDAAADSRMHADFLCADGDAAADSRMHTLIVIRFLFEFLGLTSIKAVLFIAQIVDPFILETCTTLLQMF
jgi:hypothetical protein